MTDFDEGLQEWRYRHIKLVERTIGAKKGTGGSPGVPFLKESLFKPIFHDLWAIRHEMGVGAGLAVIRSEEIRGRFRRGVARCLSRKDRQAIRAASRVVLQ